jgi:hypothetical protein
MATPLTTLSAPLIISRGQITYRQLSIKLPSIDHPDSVAGPKVGVTIGDGRDVHFRFFLAIRKNSLSSFFNSFQERRLFVTTVHGERSRPAQFGLKW